MAQAYGLYTHIRANRIRSVLLMIGMFLLIYVVVYAVALGFRAFMYSNASLNWLLQHAWLDLKSAWPFATVAALIWMAIAYRYHQALIDSVTGGHDVTRKEEPR